MIIIKSIIVSILIAISNSLVFSEDFEKQIIFDKEINFIRTSQVIDSEKLYSISVEEDSNGVYLLIEKFDLVDESRKSYKKYVYDQSRYKSTKFYVLGKVVIKGDDLFLLTQYDVLNYKFTENSLELISKFNLDDYYNDMSITDERVYLLSVSQSNLRRGLPLVYYSVYTIYGEFIETVELKDMDELRLLRFLPRKTFSILGSKILISDILRYHFYIYDIRTKEYKEFTKDNFESKINYAVSKTVIDVYEKLKTEPQVLYSLFINDSLIMVSYEKLIGDEKMLFHDIRNIDNNFELIHTFEDRRMYNATNKDFLFGNILQAGNGYVISINKIPFELDREAEEYKLHDSINSYYLDNDLIKSTLFIKEISE